MANEDKQIVDGRDDIYARRARSDDRVLFPEAKFLQGADLNDAFDASENARQEIGDLIAADGDRLSGAEVVVDANAATVTISAGVLYIRGAPRPVDETVLSSVPMTGDVTIGVYLTQLIEDDNDDADLRGLHAGTEAFEEPGSVRLKYTTSLGYDSDGQSGEFYSYVLIRDGQLVSQDAPPSLSGVESIVGKYDYAANGNYLVNGCEVVYLGESVAGDSEFSIASGEHNVLGQKVNRPVGTRYTRTPDPDIGRVDAEAHLFEDGGSGTHTFTVNRQPIAAIVTMTITKERTVTLTKGTTGTADALPDDSVTIVSLVEQGGTTYVETTDYIKTGDTIDWSPGGDEPLTGSSYDVTYQYLDAVAVDAFDDTTITVSGGVTNGTMFVQYDYKLARKDRICLDSFGNVLYLKGQSSATQPVAPLAPDNALSLAVVSNDWFNNPTVRMDTTPAYTNDLIHRYIKLVRDTASRLGLVELEADIAARAASYPSGQFTEQFSDDSNRDTGEAQTAAVFDGIMQIPITPTLTSVDLEAPQMLSFNEVSEIDQLFVTGCVKINPYQSFLPVPAQMSITPSRDFWTEVNEVWQSEETRTFGTGNRTLVENVEILEDTTVITARFLRQIPVAFEIRDLGAGEEVTTLEFDGVDVHPGSLTANASGIVSGSFTIPSRVASGRRLLKAETAAGRVARAAFRGEGVIETISLQRVTTLRRFEDTQIVRQDFESNAGADDSAPLDPQAQSFSLETGKHISSIDIRFCAIGDITKPVIVDIVEVENGVPTTRILAQTEIDMSTVLVNQMQKFTFATPRYLPPTQLFAFVVKTDDADHSISEATLGGFDTLRQRFVSAQPYTIGDRFSSSNAESWLVHPKSDLTMEVRACEFTPTTREVSVGTHSVANCSDFMVLASAELPEDGASVMFSVQFGTEDPVLALPGQVLERASYFTGDVVVKAILNGTSRVSPTLASDVVLVAGEMQTEGTYISRAFPMGASAEVTVILSALLPVGSDLTVEVDAADDNWSAMALQNATVIDRGFVEREYRISSHAAANGGRIRITMTGTPEARPSIADLRAFSI